MEFTGQLVGVSRDWKTNQIHITFSLNEQGRLASVDDIKDAESACSTLQKTGFRAFVCHPSGQYID